MTDVRGRLLHALRTDATLPALRESLINIAADLEEEATPTARGADEAPDTLPDSAPPTPADSALGREFGP